jgi:hypothetical protein
MVAVFMRGPKIYKGWICGALIDGKLRAVSVCEIAEDGTELKVLVHYRRKRATEKANPWEECRIVTPTELIQLPAGNPKLREALEDKEQRPYWSVMARVKQPD